MKNYFIIKAGYINNQNRVSKGWIPQLVSVV